MTKLNPNYVHAKFKLRAKIAGFDFSDEIVAISASFPLNTIPTASITLAVGMRAGSPGKFASIHMVKTILQPRAPVTVFLTITPTAGKKDKTESGEIKIFEGFLASMGYQRSHNSANYVINVVHWLDDLNNSSMLNGKWFPNAPFLMAQNAAFQALQTNEGSVWSPVPVIDANEDIITETNISQNLWGDVIKPIFEEMANWDTPSADPNDASIKPNRGAQAALARIPAEAPSSVPGENTKLSLDISGVGLNAEHSIRQALTKDAVESFAYTTFWSTLAGDYASQFLFAVSPCIDKAYVVPFFGGLKFSGRPELTIEADDYSYANFNATMHQIIESVTVFWPGQMDPMLHLGGEVTASDRFALPAGQWPPTEIAQKPWQGLKLFKDLPSWLANTSPWPIMCGPTTGEGGKRPGDCLAPQTGESQLPAGWKKPDELANEMSDQICTRFAKHFYHTEFLSQRYGELSGKLRFDIAPGSIVKIKLPDTELGEVGHMVAAVTKVSYAINAERALAGTSFDLSYIRTDDEDNRQDKITQTSSPLYSGAKWSGYTLK
jgi:hypothetical protein